MDNLRGHPPPPPKPGPPICAWGQNVFVHGIVVAEGIKEKGPITKIVMEAPGHKKK